MMMIAARGQKQRARITAHHGVEPEPMMVEPRCGLQVADVEVNMADGGA